MFRPALLLGVVSVLVQASAAGAAGILLPREESLPPLRVTDHLVKAKIHDRIALTTVRQTFRNQTDRRLEAMYVFPLPEQAELTDFRMTVNGKEATGQVLPADEAARIYEAIVRRSRDPGLIEFIGRRLLQMRVFPVEPKSDTTIQMQYQQICSPVNGMLAYHYPLRTRKTAGQAYGTVRFVVELETNAPCKSIWSPTHAVEIVRDPKDERRATIAYEATGGSLEDDFLLLYETDASDLGLSVVAYKPRSGEPGHFVLMLTPRQLWPEEAREPQDVVFVLDTSGSMAGDKLEQARSALKYCIDRLDDRDRFSVVRFSSGFDVLFEPVQAAGETQRAKARAWVERFTAAGGTNIADTLRHVLEMAPARAEGEAPRPFVVVFLTDGRGNRGAEEIMKVLAGGREGTAELRLFPFGVGEKVNTKLLDRLSETYHGRTTYVQAGENLEIRLGDFFSVISRPVLADLRLQLPEIGPSERFPATLGDLYHGQQLIIAGRYDEPVTGPVRLSATRGGQRVEFVWPEVSFASVAGADYVPAVWAGRKIAYLIDEIRRHGESSEMIEEILALSQRYRIQTPYTSWLVKPESAIVHAGDINFPWQRGGGAQPDSRAPLREAQRRALRRAAPDAAAPGSAGGGGGGGSLFGSAGDESGPGAALRYGDGSDEIDLVLAGESVTKATGKLANLIARVNARMKDLSTPDSDRLNTAALSVRKLGARWYHRIGRVLVDREFDEKTSLLLVRFASPAYFELVEGRGDLRAALAASPDVVVMVGPGRAVLVSQKAGIDVFSGEQREECGLKGR